MQLHHLRSKPFPPLIITDYTYILPIFLQKYKKVLRDALEKYVDYDEDVMGVLKEQNGLHLYTSFGDYYMIESYMKETADITVW